MIQTYNNHRRWTPSFHFFTLPLVVALLVAAAVNLLYATRENLFHAVLLLLGSIIIASLYYHVRVFALKLQSRVIRTEEDFRHFRLTGFPLDPRLRLSQIIALRFATDDQFVELAKKAVDEKLSNNAIKKLVLNWRGDYHRV